MAQPAPPPAFLRPLFSQFGCPRGWLGAVSGLLMARNRYDDEWIADLLDVQPHDRVLEVGFGPGIAIEVMAERATKGKVAGVDPSEVMLIQATRRNARAIHAGRVEPKLGAAEQLPFSDASFSKAFALHSIYFWPSVERGLAELHRVLAPDGKLAIGVRMRQERGLLNPSRYGMTAEQVDEICHSLERAGFTHVTRTERDFPRELVTVILASR
jgi:ubiquinone/menaquinone biosynthesis C-methylase UbiE